MALFETVALTIGASTAKALLKSWLGDGVAANVLPSVVDLLKDRGMDEAKRRQSERQIEEIGRRVAERMRLIFEQDRARMDASSQEAVVREVATTLA